MALQPPSIPQLVLDKVNASPRPLKVVEHEKRIHIGGPGTRGSRLEIQVDYGGSAQACPDLAICKYALSASLNG